MIKSQKKNVEDTVIIFTQEAQISSADVRQFWWYHWISWVQKYHNKKKTKNQRDIRNKKKNTSWIVNKTKQ